MRTNQINPMTKECLVADFSLPTDADLLGLSAVGGTKANAGCNDVTDDLNATTTAKRGWLSASATEATPNTYKPEIPKVEVIAGHVQLRFQKVPTDGVNPYSRRKGQSTQKSIACDTNSPYDHYTAPAVPGTLEDHEYQAYGGLSDQEIGQPSDIMGVTFGR